MAEVAPLAVDDARALKLSVFLLFSQPMNAPKQRPIHKMFSGDVLNEIGEIEMPDEPPDETFDKLSRVEFNGGPC